jgi:hypothetical protein
MTRKAMIAAFYRELYEGKNGTEEYERQAMARLGTILQQFRRDNKSFPGPVQDAWEFFSYYAELNWFPRYKKMLEELSDNMLIGKVDMEFKAFLRAEQYKVRPVEDPEEMHKTTLEELAWDRKELKKELRPLQRLVRRLLRKKDAVSVQVLKVGLKREVDRKNDPNLRQEDDWKLKDAINSAIEKARQKK